MIYAIDFDNTLCTLAWPGIGQPIPAMIEFVKLIKSSGHRIILWTCREGEKLDEAVEWCRRQGIVFDAVNANLPERIEQYGGDSRKISADFYVDDLALLPCDLKLIYEAGLIQNV